MWKLPVIIHNFKGYDSHLIVKALEKENGRVQIIPNNMEKYISMSVGQVRFIDSFQFMNSGLGALVDNLDASDLYFTNNQFPDLCTLELVK